MKKNLLAYIKHYKSFIDKKMCDQTIKQLKSLDNSGWSEHTFYDSKTNTTKTRSGNKELSVCYSNKILNKKILMDKLWEGIHKYITQLNFSWFDSWNGYTEIRFNKYLKNKKMAMHCDHIQSMFDGKRKGVPLLSVLGLLNDDYEGGEFIIFEKKEIKLKKGDLLIFPSIFLYPHKVNVVKKGTRYSFISWVW